MNASQVQYKNILKGKPWFRKNLRFYFLKSFKGYGLQLILTLIILKNNGSHATTIAIYIKYVIADDITAIFSEIFKRI